MKVLSPVPPKFVNVFTIEIKYMFGDGDSYETEEFRLIDPDFIESAKKFKEQYDSGYSYPESYDENFKEFMNLDLLKTDECDNQARIESVKLFWYDENGNKFNAEF